MFKKLFSLFRKADPPSPPSPAGPAFAKVVVDFKLDELLQLQLQCDLAETTLPMEEFLVSAGPFVAGLSNVANPDELYALLETEIGRRRQAGVDNARDEILIYCLGLTSARMGKMDRVAQAADELRECQPDKAQAFDTLVKLGPEAVPLVLG